MVAPRAVAEHLLAPAADLAVARGSLGFRAGVIALVIAGLQLAQRQLREGIARSQLHGLAADAFPPQRPVSDGRAGRAVTVFPVDCVDGARVHRPALMLYRSHDVVRT